MSDYDALSFKLLTNLGKQYLQPRKIFQYHKADKNNITTEVNKLLEIFFQQDPYQRTVNENGTLFKTNIMEIVENYVPSKEIKPTKDVPWLNHSIKWKMKN